MLGLDDHRLTSEGLANLTGAQWKLTPVADRAGLRHAGLRVRWREREQPFGVGSDPSNIVDAGYAMGSIQIPGGAQPIVLHRAAVFGGGYAMVAIVISADMDLVARAAPARSPASSRWTWPRPSRHAGIVPRCWTRRSDPLSL
jgi:allophanate hydrolase subunit 2